MRGLKIPESVKGHVFPIRLRREADRSNARSLSRVHVRSRVPDDVGVRGGEVKSVERVVDHLRIWFPVANVVNGDDSVEVVMKVPPSQYGLNGRSSGVGHNRHLETLFAESVERFRDERIVVDAPHVFDNGRPDPLLKALAVCDAVVTDNLVGAAMKAVGNEVLFGWIDAVLAHGVAKCSCP